MLITDLFVSAVPRTQAGTASALSETSVELGIALGVGTLGSIGATIYREQIDAHLNDCVPSVVLEEARDNVVDAMAAAARYLSSDLGGQLMKIAQGRSWRASRP